MRLKQKKLLESVYKSPFYVHSDFTTPPTKPLKEYHPLFHTWEETSYLGIGAIVEEDIKRMLKECYV